MVNLLDDWKNLCAKRIDAVTPGSAFPLLRWMSGKPENLLMCANIDELFFKVPPSVVISLLSANCVGGWIKYPKKTPTEKNTRDDLFKEKVKQFFKWSDREFEKNISVMQFVDIKDIARHIGLDKKESKILGVEYAERKYKFVADKPKPKGLDRFM